MIDETKQNGTGAAADGSPEPANDPMALERNEHQSTAEMPGGTPQAAESGPTPEEELAEARDRVLRTLAEMENLRRRTQREIEEARKYAITGFARGLLEVADNLSRALSSVPADMRERDEFLKNLVIGVEMTERSLLNLFEKHEVRKVEPQKGERFDHKLHQAMFELPTAEFPAGTIAEVLQPGYVVADRLLRPAMVGVARPPADRSGGEQDEASTLNTLA
jgi:molecular chaperone GrpE